MKEEHRIDVTDAINALKEEDVLSWVAEQLRLRIEPLVIVSQLTAGLEKLGQRFATGECFIPELIREIPDIAGLLLGIWFFLVDQPISSEIPDVHSI